MGLRTGFPAEMKQGRWLAHLGAAA